MTEYSHRMSLSDAQQLIAVIQSTGYDPLGLWRSSQLAATTAWFGDRKLPYQVDMIGPSAKVNSCQRLLAGVSSTTRRHFRDILSSISVGLSLNN